MRAIDRLIEKNNRGECDEIEKAILSCYYDGSPSQAVRAAEQYAQQPLALDVAESPRKCTTEKLCPVHNVWHAAPPRK